MLDVFIIGAGCSVPYGFPTGAMLMQKLKNFDYKDRVEYTAQHLLDRNYLFDLYPERLRFTFDEYKNKARQIEGYNTRLNSEKQTINNIVSSTVKGSVKGLSQK